MYECVLDPVGGIFVLAHTAFHYKGRKWKEDTFSNFLVGSCKLCVCRVLVDLFPCRNPLLEDEVLKPLLLHHGQ